MKAAILISDKKIIYSDYPDKEMGANDVKISIKACGICGSDVPRVLGGKAHFYPIVLGHEFAGVVEEIGENVKSIKVGDHVSGAPLLPCMKCDNCKKGDYALCRKYSFIGSREAGGFSDCVVLPERNVIKMSDNIPFTAVAMLEPITVALHGIMQGKFKGGEYTAVLGVGTIGMFTAQWAKILGAKRVVVFDISDERLALAKELGADVTINTTKTDFIQEALKATDGKGFGFVFECVGSNATMKYAFELAAEHANVCFIGTPSRDISFTPAEWENLNRKEFHLTGSFMSYSLPFPGVEWSQSAKAIGDGTIYAGERLIYKTLPMSQADKAFAIYENSHGINGKIMLVN